jgi:hypothetical protein
MRKYCLFAVVVYTLLAAPSIQGLVITPQTGNGPFADGDIGQNIGGTVWPPDTSNSIGIGDDSGSGSQEIIYRSFIGFDLLGLSGPSASNAVLYLSCYQGSGNLNNIIIDVVDFGDSLDASDYDVTAIDPGVASFSSGQTGYLAINVTDAVNSALSAGRIQFRLRAEVEEAMPGQNMVLINNVEDFLGNGEIPKLDVAMVPEPASLFLIGLGGLILHNRKGEKR